MMNCLSSVKGEPPQAQYEIVGELVWRQFEVDVMLKYVKNVASIQYMGTKLCLCKVGRNVVY